MSDNTQAQYHIPVVELLNGFVRRIAETTAWFNVALILVIVVQVVMRYGFSKGLVPLEELMWHLYAVAFMFGMAYSAETSLSGFIQVQETTSRARARTSA